MKIDAASIVLRKATPDDAALLAQLGAATFTETFGHLYPPADLQAFLDTAHSVWNWERTLADSSNACWLAQSASERSAGYVVAGNCKLPVTNREPAAGEVHQLYLLAEFHNRGLGSRLLETALAWLHTANKTPIYIGVWSKNYGAQRFYARYGFEKVGDYGFPVGATVDHEFILKR